MRSAGTNEGDTVNQSFNAFGSLLLMLAVAMLAVNSGSRTTMFDRPPAAAKRCVPSRGSRIGGVYVIVMPAADMEDRDLGATPIGAVEREYLSIFETDIQNRTRYDATYDAAVYGELAENMSPELTAVHSSDLRLPVRSSRWLLRFAVSSLNEMSRVCEAAASKLEILGSDPLASDSDVLAR